MRRVKYLVVVLVLILLGVVVMSRESFRDFDDSAIIGVVVENGEHGLIINHGGEIIVSTKKARILGSDGKSINLSDIKSGYEIQIKYGGGIAESYPAQIHKTYEIRVLKE